MNFDSVSLRQPLQRGQPQILLSTRFNGLVILVGNTAQLGERLLRQVVEFSEVFQPG